MERKLFLSSFIPAAASLREIAMGFDVKEKEILATTPAFLQRGDTIGITSPAGSITLEECTDAINTIEGWGFRVRVGNTIGKKDFTFGGTDEERAADLQQMLDDDSVSAILCARGGYGLVRIIDKINFNHFIHRPKWLIGFSDATVLHCHVNSNFHIATLHSKMCNSFPAPGTTDDTQIATIDSIRKCLTGESINYTTLPDPNNRTGTTTAPLIGGNLKTIESLLATVSDIDTQNKILFVEDTGEYLYSIDRMFCHLQRSGKLKTLKGLIVGGFKIKPDDAGEVFGETLAQIVLGKTAAYDYPVCFGFPVGHQKDNFALKCGVMHQLEVTDAGVRLTALA